MDDIKLFENWFKSTKWFTGYNCTPKYITYRSMLQAWQASAQRDGYKLVPVEASKELSDKLEDMASCQPSYDGIDIYKVAIGELDYDWKTGTNAMIGASDA